MATNQATAGDDAMESESRPATLTIGTYGPNEHVTTERTTLGALTAEPRRERIDGPIVWLIGSVALVGFIAFGSFSVQVWRFSDFLMQYYPIRVPRRILHIWVYQGRQLPDVQFQVLLLVAYYAVLFVCVAGAIYGLWLLLDRAGTGAGRRHRAAQYLPRIDE